MPGPAIQTKSKYSQVVSFISSYCFHNSFLGEWWWESSSKIKTVGVLASCDDAWRVTFLSYKPVKAMLAWYTHYKLQVYTTSEGYVGLNARMLCPQDEINTGIPVLPKSCCTQSHTSTKIEAISVQSNASIKIFMYQPVQEPQTHSKLKSK